MTAWHIMLQAFSYALSELMGVFYILFMNLFALYSMHTAVSDVTDMQLAKHSISGQEKQISAEL